MTVKRFEITHSLVVENMAAINSAKSLITKHIDKLCFIRKYVYDRIFLLHNASSMYNLADAFTKPFTKYDLSKFRSYYLI